MPVSSSCLPSSHRLSARMGSRSCSNPVDPKNRANDGTYGPRTRQHESTHHTRNDRPARRVDVRFRRNCVTCSEEKSHNLTRPMNEEPRQSGFVTTTTSARTRARRVTRLDCTRSVTSVQICQQTSDQGHASRPSCNPTPVCGTRYRSTLTESLRGLSLCDGGHVRGGPGLPLQHQRPRWRHRSASIAGKRHRGRRAVSLYLREI